MGDRKGPWLAVYQRQRWAVLGCWALPPCSPARPTCQARRQPMLPFPKDFFEAVVGDILEEHHLDVEFRCIHADDALPTKQIWFRRLSDMEERWPEIQDLT